MSNERTFFGCSKCGNFVAMIENSNVPMTQFVRLERTAGAKTGFAVDEGSCRLYA